MTLSRFLRDYLYVPLGGNRSGSARRYFNLMATMLLGGLWHGAGWTYIVWGGLHGIYLVINHVWQGFMGRLGWQTGHLYEAGAKFFTFTAVAFAWIFFRAADFSTAAEVIGGLIGNNGVSLPPMAKPYVGLLNKIGMHPVFNGIRWIDAFGMTVLCGGILLATLAPNTQEIFRRFEPCLEKLTEPEDWPRLVWQPSLRWSLGLALLLCICILSLNRPSEFLYFQF